MFMKILGRKNYLPPSFVQLFLLFSKELITPAIPPGAAMTINARIPPKMNLQ
jgi:hypothetical protein